jgi:hypothetical protein
MPCVPRSSSPAIRARRSRAIVDDELGAGDAVYLRSADEGGRPAVRRGQGRSAPTFTGMELGAVGDLEAAGRPGQAGPTRYPLSASDLIGGFSQQDIQLLDVT